MSTVKTAEPITIGKGKEKKSAKRDLEKPRISLRQA